MAFDELLANRVRACLQHVGGVSERKMFGGLAFMIGGHLTAGVYNDGLIARIGAQDMDAAITKPGVRPFDMTGRPMRGIVVLDSSMLDDQALDRWIRQPPRLRGRLAAGIAHSPRAAARSSHHPG
jgi:TfoX/Sxy family transcriptional regulator of competence genes